MISTKLVYLWALTVAVPTNVTANASLKMAMVAVSPDSEKAKVLQLLEQSSFWVGLVSAGLLLVSYLVAIRSGPVGTDYITVTSLATVGLLVVERKIFVVPVCMAKIVEVFLIDMASTLFPNRL